MSFLCFNDEFLPSDQPLITVQNRGFRYGDGVFETIKIFQGKIILDTFHFDRLFLGLQLLCINPSNIDKDKIAKQIADLCKMNNCRESARVRLAVFRNDDNSASYVIEAVPLAVPNRLNETGWTIDIYPFARKSMDAFSNLKTANYLAYVLADKYASEKAVNECLVLNTENKICDASKANIFLVKKNEVFTPALHQGCVSGVMRRLVIEELKKAGYTLYQKEVDEKMLFESDEVFLTNSINDIRWVGSFRNKTYANGFVTRLYEQVCSTIYR